MIKNHVESMVDHIVNNMVEKNQLVCACESCIENIKAIVLNHMSPMYYCEDPREVLSDVTIQRIHKESDIIEQIDHAKKIVENNPRH